MFTCDIKPIFKIPSKIAVFNQSLLYFTGRTFHVLLSYFWYLCVYVFSLKFIVRSSRDVCPITTCVWHTNIIQCALSSNSRGDSS